MSPSQAIYRQGCQGAPGAIEGSFVSASNLLDAGRLRVVKVNIWMFPSAGRKETNWEVPKEGKERWAVEKSGS